MPLSAVRYLVITPSPVRYLVITPLPRRRSAQGTSLRGARALRQKPEPSPLGLGSLFTPRRVAHDSSPQMPSWTPPRVGRRISPTDRAPPQGQTQSPDVSHQSSGENTPSKFRRQPPAGDPPTNARHSRSNSEDLTRIPELSRSSPPHRRGWQSPVSTSSGVAPPPPVVASAWFSNPFESGLTSQPVRDSRLNNASPPQTNTAGKFPASEVQAAYPTPTPIRLPYTCPRVVTMVATT